MAFPHATLRRPIRAAPAVRIYRQAASESRAGNDATFHCPPPDTHAGAVRTHELQCGGRLAGRGVMHSDVCKR